MIFPVFPTNLRITSWHSYQEPYNCCWWWYDILPRCLRGMSCWGLSKDDEADEATRSRSPPARSSHLLLRRFAGGLSHLHQEQHSSPCVLSWGHVPAISISSSFSKTSCVCQFHALFFNASVGQLALVFFTFLVCVGDLHALLFSFKVPTGKK